MIKKPETYLELLNLQKILDTNVAKNRNNGFIPRSRTNLDIKLALDDEFQEWLRELPQEYNFKYWKQKEYNREKELEELTDCLFFLLAYENNNDQVLFYDWFERFNEIEYALELREYIVAFKELLWGLGKRDAIYILVIRTYIQIIKKRGFTKEDIINTYWEKWQRNMKRPNEDWNLPKGY